MAAVATAAECRTDSASAAASDKPREEYDVLIVGAGIAGLAAATALRRNAPACTFIVLEAADRVGGRIHTVSVGGVACDLGAAYIHGGSDGSNPLSQHVDGTKMITRNTSLLVASAKPASQNPWVNPHIDICTFIPKDAICPIHIDEQICISHCLTEFANAVHSVGSACATGDEPAFGNVGALLHNCATTSACATSAFMMRAIAKMIGCWYGEDVGNISMEDYLSEFPGDMVGDHCVPIHNKDADPCFRGMGQTVSRMQAAVEASVHKSTIVEEIRWCSDASSSVTVTARQGESTVSYACHQLILAIPVPCIVGPIKFTPPLPPEKLAALGHVKQTFYKKVFLKCEPWPLDEYSTPFIVLEDEESEFDMLENHMALRGQPILCGVTCGDPSRGVHRLLTSLEDTARKLGNKDFVVTASHTSDWESSAFTGGCAYFTWDGCEDDPHLEKNLCATLKCEDARGKLVPKVYFAGDCYDLEYMGSAHGAYMTGEKVAKRVIKSIASTSR